MSDQARCPAVLNPWTDRDSRPAEIRVCSATEPHRLKFVVGVGYVHDASGFVPRREPRHVRVPFSEIEESYEARQEDWSL